MDAGTECTKAALPLTLREKLVKRFHGDRFRLYMVPGYGITYRALSKIGHRLHLHYMPPRYIEDDIMRRCSWCGISHVTRPMKTPPAN